MIRHTARALCAASLIVTPLVLSTPAHAATTCRVNGVSVTGTTITGTPGSDYITCDTVDVMNVVNGAGGDDFISVGTANGPVAGGDGRDYITVGTVGSSGSVLGQAGNDYIRVTTNNGSVDGGLAGLDYCRVTAGNPPTNCEF
ncbi:hypothetical protein ACIGO8_25515 [Streptomyces sp. NPDC053493]|uniref:hypothetical protein n=1 Tax=Streptomyces sp. NPDC053493 TaxID=3365705 RepID=UPI0037D7D4BD